MWSACASVSPWPIALGAPRTDGERRRSPCRGRGPLPRSPWRIARGACRTFPSASRRKLVEFDAVGHPMEIGYDFQKHALMKEVAAANAEAGGEAMPYLGALVCLSAFDVAVHDAYRRPARARHLRLLWAGTLEPRSGGLCRTGARKPGGFQGQVPEGLSGGPSSPSRYRCGISSAAWIRSRRKT